MQKRKSERALVEVLRRLRKQSKIIVTYNGSFDLLHLGHIRSLQEAKRQGDVLAVLLNSDTSVRLYKGPSHPVVPEQERAQMLEALSCVDYVTLFDDITPMRILEKLRPNVHCNGSDWGKDCVEREAVERHGGKIYVLKHVPGYSTSKLLSRIRKVSVADDVKAVFLDRDGTINENREGYVYKKEDIRLKPSAIPALRRLSGSGYKIIIVSNQSGIGRGYYARKEADALFAWLQKEMKKKGVRIDAVYYCPHKPEAGCSCRKPGIVLLLQASKDFGLNLSKSWFVGDEEKDVSAGRYANTQTILVGGKMPKNAKLQPNHRAATMKEAVDIIMKA